MGSTDTAETQLRKKLRAERERRGWSQAHLAELLCDKGLTIYHTTIAKIEAGDRVAKIDEIAAIADVFNVSIDSMVGRSTNTTNDLAFAFRALIDTTQRSARQAEQSEAKLRDAMSDLAALDTEHVARTFIARCEHATDALADASARLRGVQLNAKGGKAFEKLLRTLQIEGTGR